MGLKGWLLAGLCVLVLTSSAWAEPNETSATGAMGETSATGETGETGATGETGETGAIKVTLRNLTGADLYALHLAPAGTGKWSEDLLAGDCLRVGSDVKVTFPWRARAIWWDIHVENRSGTVVTWTNVPMRRFRVLTLLFDGNKPKIRGE